MASLGILAKQDALIAVIASPRGICHLGISRSLGFRWSLTVISASMTVLKHLEMPSMGDGRQ